MGSKDHKAAAQERRARERGKALSHYTRNVVKKLASPPKRGKATPSKRATT